MSGFLLCCPFILMFIRLSFSSWNIRGLGDQRKCEQLKAAYDLSPPSVLCIQESKLSDISSFKASSFLPPSLRSFVFKPSNGASGGIITAWNANLLDLVSHAVNTFSVTTIFSFRLDDFKFAIINVYGPCTHDLKPVFLASLASDYSSLSCPTAIIGDFNLVRAPEDRSNSNFNASEALAFNDVINSLCLMEIPLLDRSFTWSNLQSSPTLVRLDRVFVNTDWTFALPDSTLSSEVRPVSDHFPIRLDASSKAPRSSIFRMENSWLSNPSFSDLVSCNWQSVQEGHRLRSSLSCICLRLKRIRAAAKKWAKTTRLPSVTLANCRSVLNLFDHLEESRPLHFLEATLRSLAKAAIGKLVAEHAAYWRLRAKIRSCTLGDENSRFFHLSASARLQKNQIKVIEADDGTPLFAHSDKALVLTSFFRNLLGTPATCSIPFDLSPLMSSTSLDTFQASKLVEPFTLDEIRSAVLSMKSDSSPGPDGFGPAFFKKYWNLVKASLLSFLHDFHSLKVDLRPINQSFIVLLPKKMGANRPDQYRPISLQNCCMKIVTKCLTSRLQHLMPALVHPDQTGFISGRSLAENFVYATDIVQTCHKRSAPTIAFKLDFCKAFDSISWEALDSIMMAKGFPPFGAFGSLRLIPPARPLSC